MIDPKYLDPATGNIIPLKIRLEAEEKARLISSTVKAVADRKREEAKPDTAKRVELAQKMHSESVERHDPVRAKFWKGQLAKLEAAYRDEQAQAKRDAEFRNDRRAILVSENAAAVSRSAEVLFPHSPQEDIQTLLAIAATEWPTPDDLAKAYWEQSDRMSDANAAIERGKALDAEERMLKAGLENAEANLRLTQIEHAKQRPE